LIAPDSLFQKKETFQQLNEVPWKLVIIDEFHKFKVSSLCAFIYKFDRPCVIF